MTSDLLGTPARGSHCKYGERHRERYFQLPAIEHHGDNHCVVISRPFELVGLLTTIHNDLQVH